jgi:methylmalonyl-CoA mutase C-terminal domain/subunit
MTVRVLTAILGLDQHETAIFAVNKMLTEAGVEVIYLGRFATPAAVCAAAVAEDVDVVGVSCHSWEFLEYVDELLAGLAEAGGIPLVMGGSVLTAGDERMLTGKGVAAVFGSGSTRSEIIERVVSLADPVRSLP